MTRAIWACSGSKPAAGGFDGKRACSQFSTHGRRGHHSKNLRQSHDLLNRMPRDVAEEVVGHEIPVESSRHYTPEAGPVSSWRTYE